MKQSKSPNACPAEALDTESPGFRRCFKLDHMGNPIFVEVETSGYREGDAGHGGYIEVTVTPTNMDFEASIYVNGDQVAHPVNLESFGIRVEGGLEYRHTIRALENILSVLKANDNMDDSFDYGEHT